MASPFRKKISVLEPGTEAMSWQSSFPFSRSDFNGMEYNFVNFFPDSAFTSEILDSPSLEVFDFNLKLQILNFVVQI